MSVRIAQAALGLTALAAIGPADARAAWTSGGSVLSSAISAAVAPDRRGGVIGCTSGDGIPMNFPWLHRLDLRGDLPVGWTPTGVALTPTATIMDHLTIAPIALLPDEFGGAYVLAGEQIPYSGHGGFIHEVQYYVHRRSGGGEVSPGWTEEGVCLSTQLLEHRFEVHRLPAWVADGRHGVLVAWLDGRAGWPNPTVHLQRVGSDGSLAWAPDGITVQSGVNVCTLPALVADGRGGALVFWGQWDSTNTRIQVRGQHVTSSGTFMWPTEGKIVSCGSFDRVAEGIPPDGGGAWDHHRPAIAAVSDGEGGAVVSWAGADGADLNLFAARVTPEGRTPWRRDAVVCSAAGDQMAVVGARLRGDEVVLGWRDTRRGADIGLYVQCVGRDGRMRWRGDGVAICAAQGERSRLAMVPDGREGIFLAWSDEAEGSRIFAQRLLGRGRLAPGWAADGELLSRSAQPYQGGVTLELIEAGRGHAIVVWSDATRGSLAMRLGPHGPAVPATDAEPAIVADSVLDVANVGATVRFALHGVAPNPVVASGVIRFELADGSRATLDLIDIAGRRVWSREVGAMGAGEHAVALVDGPALPAGIYFVRLVQGTRAAAARVAVLR